MLWTDILRDKRAEALCEIKKALNGLLNLLRENCS